jgi:flagellar hook-basal body complex protein FliE
MAILPVTGIGATPAIAPTPATSSSSSVASSGFSDTLEKVLGSVEDSNGQANQAISKMLDGSGDVHEAMIAMQKADTMFQLTVQIRNKIVQAYQDIMRMPV